MRAMGASGQGSGDGTLSDRALGRALLARQGLLERFDAPLAQAVEAIGAMQGQAWGALPVGLWSRVASFYPQQLYEALARRELLWGIGIRGTLHLVSAREHPAYATVAAEGWTSSWQRVLKETPPAMTRLREELLRFVAHEPRSNEEIRQLAERWVEEHPNAIDARELEAQRALKWRPIYRWSALIRAPKDGAWAAKAPADHLAAPVAPGSLKAPKPQAAVEQVVRSHLRAFGPAAVDDVVCWSGARAPLVREALERMAPKLASFADEHGRTLYDLPEAPRPDPQTPAPARLLGAFDSTLLAYAVKRRERILPEALREMVFQGKNLQVKPTFLLDGRVAGTWALETRGRRATVRLRAAGRLAKGEKAALSAEAQGLMKALCPKADSLEVSFE
jgi:Winged helix DNA-binding domain